MLYALGIFLPLVAAAIAGLFGRVLGDRGAQIVTCGALGVSAAIAVALFIDVALGGNPQVVRLFTWIASGSLDVSWSLRFDTLSAVLILTVTWVSFMVHVYSVGYMAHDDSVPRFMAYLSLFTFFMLMLVTANDLVQLFFGWEGVGLASYLLIGFWYKKPSANAAAVKAFVVNRVGDFGFALGIFATFLLFDTVAFEPILNGAAAKADATFSFLGHEVHAMTTIALLLFIGAMGKSAQLGLHTWLPDAMEGPTPVSALIHAATMVTAGVFMVARMSPVFAQAPDALAVVTLIGAATALFAATVGCVQNDIKRVIAYSTCSQLGYMFFALGVGAYQAAIFHLFTHAFFKALLFLGAGSVIHAMSDEQDIRRMGGIWRHIKLTYAMMWIGSLALAGVPFFAGFYSKDIVLEAAFGAHSTVGLIAYWCGLFAAILTAFYSWRLLILTFHGEPRADEKTMAHVHESPAVMTIPLIVLAIGAVFAGFVGYNVFVGDAQAGFWGASIDPSGTKALDAAHHVPLWVKLATPLVGIVGILIAWYLYVRQPALPGKFAADFQGLYRFLLNKWYFDELYRAIFVRPSFALGRILWRGGDMGVIDPVGPDGVAGVSRGVASLLSRAQTGFVHHYAFLMIIGLVVFVGWYALAVLVS